ncbi:hypothetical protein NONI108955_20630 [Nocardia ninae]|uniref:Uncharacterized protein n=1 Tax=Nocardia ninae NBRC 108245 TaxID=1210091 RepID=A0A511MCJ3_9NOCA|nr:hypothetical protein [Nocardia ninae]GEM38372.1 hypothetical protein NN4_28910 [Nocardia ninae NBRC 108245]
MAAVYVDQEAVRIELGWWERLFAGQRKRLVVPVASIVEAERVDRPTKFSATPGARSGLVVTGVVKVGRWGIGTGTSLFVSVRRSVPALRLAIDKPTAEQLGFDVILVSTPEVDRLVGSLTNGSVTGAVRG